MSKVEQERERPEYWWNETGLMDAAVEAVARAPFIDAQALRGGPGGGGEECGRGEQWPRQGRFLYEKRGPSYYTRIPLPLSSSRTTWHCWQRLRALFDPQPLQKLSAVHSTTACSSLSHFAKETYFIFYLFIPVCHTVSFQRWRQLRICNC